MSEGGGLKQIKRRARLIFATVNDLNKSKLLSLGVCKLNHKLTQKLALFWQCQCACSNHIHPCSSIKCDIKDWAWDGTVNGTNKLHTHTGLRNRAKIPKLFECNGGFHYSNFIVLKRAAHIQMRDEVVSLLTSVTDGGRLSSNVR